MIFIFEGVDNCGKSTQAKKLFNYLNKNSGFAHYIHCSSFETNPPNLFFPNRTIKSNNIDHYDALLKDLSFAQSHYILDRSHLGEWVYGQIYRNYLPLEIFEIEKKYFKNRFDDVLPILFTDTVENIIARDDGKSFSIDPIKKKIEIDRFKEAFELTNFKNQIIININNKNEDIIWDEIFEKITTIGKKK